MDIWTLVDRFGPMVISLLVLVFGWRKQRADAAKTLTEAALGLINPQNERIESQEAEIRDLRVRVVHIEEEFEKLLAGAWCLHDQVVELQQQPVYVPPDRRHVASRKLGTGPLNMAGMKNPTQPRAE